MRQEKTITKNNKFNRDDIRIKDWIFITIGAILVALGSNLFFAKFNLVTGGVIGIGIIMKEFYNIPLWLTNVSLNIPLFILAVLIKGKKLGIKSLYGTFILTIALYVTDVDYTLTTDILLGCIYGGVITGAGLGFVFSGFGTTGGTDLLATIVKHFIPYVSIGKTLGAIEMIIIIAGACVFGIDKALLAIIAIYISTKVTDTIVDGMKYGKTVYIISNKYKEISTNIMKELNRGVTTLNGTGMYSREEKRIILCVIKMKQLPLLKQVVYNIDNDAFVFVNDAKEVLGNGFRNKEENI